MMEKQPFSEIVMANSLFILVSLWGGLASYVQKVKGDMIHKFSIVELVGELSISGFVGVITMYLCIYWKVDMYLSGALIGTSGHMGSRAIFLFERFVIKRWDSEISQLTDSNGNK